MRNKGKYSMKTENKPLGLFLIVIFFLAIGVALIFVCGKTESNKVPQNTTESTADTESMPQSTVPLQDSTQTNPTGAADMEAARITIDTKFCQLLFPGANSQYLRHDEVEQESVVMENFRMVTETVEVDLFQLCFSPTPSENDIGLLKTEEGNIYISISVFASTGDELLDEETINLYHELMSGVDVILESVRNHGQFSKNDEVELNVVDTKLDFWNVSLIENMTFEEVRQDESYLVTFYGKLNGEYVKLYCAFIGEPQLKSALGFYELDGEMKPVSVETCELPSTEAWSEKDITELYMMMSTINDLIQAIISNPAFSENLTGG